MHHRNLWILTAAFLASTLAPAQWLHYPTAGIPRTADGKPNLAAPAPRARDGHPDLSGLWLTDTAPPEILHRYIPEVTNGAGDEVPSQYFLNLLSDFPPDKPPLQPAAAESYRQRAPRFTRESPISNCLPQGMPLVEIAPAPYKIFQLHGMTLMLYERDTTFRQIYTDGRELPDDPQPTWLGYSVGRWDGDTFVVDSNGFNDRGWLDVRGHNHSEAMRLTERFHRLDFGRMELTLTIDDPKTYTQPITYKVMQRLQPDTDLLESFCAENEKDVSHAPGK